MICSTIKGKYFQDLIQNTLHNYLVYHIYSETDFNNTIGTKLHWEKLYFVYWISIILKTCQNKFQDERGELIRFSILSILNEILENFQIGIVLADTDKRYIMVFSFNNTPETETVEECFTYAF